ncbi:MAG: hypothetical protein AB8B91_23120 [Rubripirellula sp.]
MSETSNSFSLGWKIAIIIALVVALANGGVSALRDEVNDDFANHEKRIDELENAIRGNDVGTAPREDSHEARIEALEEAVNVMKEQ